VPLIVSIFYFGFIKREFAPSINYVKLIFVKDLTALGLKFFAIQISSVIILATNNILIAQFSGPETVTAYNIAFKYFGILAMFYTIIITPMWSAFTEAYKKNDLEWIVNTLRTMLYIWIVMVIIAVIMVLLADVVFRIWIGPSVTVPLLMSVFVAVLMLANSWVSLYHHFINGTSKITLQMILTLSGGVIYIPLVFFLVRVCHLGANGVILGSIICVCFNAISAPIQTRKILQKKDHGIWGK
jgi:O-antigen/teichoic acid export membrane protein